MEEPLKQLEIQESQIERKIAEMSLFLEQFPAKWIKFVAQVFGQFITLVSLPKVAVMQNFVQRDFVIVQVFLAVEVELWLLPCVICLF